MKQKVQKCRVVGAIVVGAVLGGVGITTTATAAPASASSITAEVQGAPVTRSGGTFVADRAASELSGVGQVGERPAGENRLSIKPVVDWVKRNAPSILSGMKNAVRSGWSSFKSWWNGLAGWIRTSISAIAQMSLNEIFNSLWNYFFG